MPKTLARPRLPSPVSGGKNHPEGHRTAGVVHDHVRHTENFTVIGNDLAQHPELSLLAIGLACYIQSVRPGTAVDIKTLAVRFPEGPTRIAAALRKLETHGYLRRSRERTATGRIITRTENLPDEPLRRPAALLAHRLAAQVPPPPPFRPPASPAPQPRHPLQTCVGCDRAFRAPAPGRCRDCRSGRSPAQAA